MIYKSDGQPPQTKSQAQQQYANKSNAACLCRTDKQSEIKHEWTTKYAFHFIHDMLVILVQVIIYFCYSFSFFIERIGIKCSGITCVITAATAKNYTISLVTTSWTPRQVNLIVFWPKIRFLMLLS